MFKKELFLSFAKYNFIAILATLTDFLVFAFLTKFVGLWYVSAAIISAVTGGIVAFIGNRDWVFQQEDGKISNQIVKYTLVWLTSILLNTSGLYLLVENINISELYAKIIVSITVGVFFNFIMNKYFVFKQHNENE